MDVLWCPILYLKSAPASLKKGRGLLPHSDWMRVVRFFGRVMFTERSSLMYIDFLQIRGIRLYSVCLLKRIK